MIRLHGQVVEGEDREVSGLTDFDGAPVDEAEEAGMLAGHGVHHLFDRKQPGVAHVASEHVGGIAGAVEHLDVGAGVADPRHGVGVADQLDHRVLIERLFLGPHARAEAVGEEPFGEGVGWMHAELGGVLFERPARLTGEVPFAVVEEQGPRTLDRYQGVLAGVPFADGLGPATAGRRGVPPWPGLGR